MSRELARWATPGRRKLRPMRGLVRDLRALVAQARWTPPEPAATARPDTRTAPVRPASPRGMLAPRTPRVQVDGPHPAPLPHGPVILVANHPTSTAAALVLSRLAAERRARTVLVVGPGEHVPAELRLARPLLRLDPHHPGRAGTRLHRLLDKGWSALIFPEGEPAAGAVKRPFHPYAAELAAAAGVPVVPVGIRGARAVGAAPGPARVSVRFGDVLPAGVDARAQEAAVAALIAEDRATWWAVQRSGPGALAGTQPPDSAHSWRHVWAQTAAPIKGGTTESPKIWQ